MSTFLIAGSPGQSLETVATSGISAGSGMQTSNSIELQVNQATSIVNDGTTTRQMSRQELLIMIEIFKEYIVRMNWPYASS